MTVFLRLDHVQEGLATGELRGSLEVYSMDAASEIAVEGRQVPLEFEPSAALAYTLDRSPVWDSEIWGFLRGSFLEGGAVLYTLTPYRLGRVPVVLIHGTASSPARWADLVNELEADPRIASRIQLWLFSYNTGLPLLYSAGLFREMLTKTVTELDPQGADPALRRMVLIGHSQGGLLAKLAVVDSGTKFWDNVERDAVRGYQGLRRDPDGPARVPLRHATAVRHARRVRRHAAAGQRRGRPPGGALPLARHVGAHAPAEPHPDVTERCSTGSEDPLLRRRLRQGMPRSVDNMSPGNPAIKTLATLPLAPGVTAHSIIAIQGGGSLGEGGDGFVSYRSAHLDEAVSELIVRSGHSVQGHPEAIEEIRRILLQHLGRAGPTAGQ